MHLWAPFALFACVSGLLMDKVDHVPQGWSEIGSPSPSIRFKLSIALIPANKKLLHETLVNISTPGHEDYGKHLNVSELKAVVRPSENSTNAVLTFLEDSGIPRSDFEQHGDWIDFTADIETADRMMNASFNRYREDTGRGIIIRTQQYSLPDEVARHVDMVAPTTQFPRVFRPRKPGSVHLDQTLPKSIDSNDCNSTITPECLRKLYNLPMTSTLKNTSAHGHIGIAGFLAEYPHQRDFDLFAETFAPYLFSSVQPRFVSIDGGEQNHSTYSLLGEGSLDVQYAAAIGYPVPVQYYYTHGLGVDEEEHPLQNLTGSATELDIILLRYLRDLPKSSLPHTLSVSYGGLEKTLPIAYARKICDMYGELGARGVTVMVSSGDDGPGRSCRGKHGKRLDPMFPATCPYVTSVGGTQFIDPESAGIISSGGFSDIFPRPEWQEKEVNDYLDILGTSLSGMYNSSGRGFPDVSAQMMNYWVVHNSQATAENSGTSASAPTVAGIVGLVNSALIGAGKSPLGFMNPFLYSVARKAFQDVDDGGSKGCLRRLQGSTVSLNATKGWDPISGIGTPDFQKLLSIAMQQQV
ncbi:subtilisin-like protein, partial [Aureobasidium melanogenum]